MEMGMQRAAATKLVNSNEVWVLLGEESTNSISTLPEASNNPDSREIPHVTENPRSC